ncbi:MAG: hypothetical protein DRP70_08700 [Spirochaetes bacterium]|nr:MAG: hypothetical protein DRP70_08700 [Spirochaetota bacterium]
MFLLISVFIGTCVSADPLYMWYTSRGETEMYLLGSIHVLSEDFYPLPDYIETLAQRADVLVLEADIREESLKPDEIAQLTMKKGFYHDGSSIEDHLEKSLYQSLSAAVNEAGLTMEQVSLMKPWLLSLTLQTFELESSGYRAGSGMEQVILKAFTRENIVELEGFEYQLELISGLGEDDQLELLNSAVKESGHIKGSLEILIYAWEQGSPELIAEELDLEGLSGGIAERLLLQRNISMAGKAAELLNSEAGKQTILFVVGAAHFTGETGIPSQLSSWGFDVSQVDNRGELILK